MNPVILEAICSLTMVEQKWTRPLEWTWNIPLAKSDTKMLIKAPDIYKESIFSINSDAFKEIFPEA